MMLNLNACHVLRLTPDTFPAEVQRGNGKKTELSSTAKADGSLLIGIRQFLLFISASNISILVPHCILGLLTVERAASTLL